MIRALAAALAVLALLPQAASAHAMLEATTPERGARLEAAPAAVTLRFSEPVEAEFGAVRVFDSEGREVQAGPLESRGAVVTARLPTVSGRTATPSPIASSRPIRIPCRAASCSWSSMQPPRPRRSASCSATTTPAR